MRRIILVFVATFTVALIAYVVGSEPKALGTSPTEASIRMLNVSTDKEVNQWDISYLKDVLENLSKILFL